MNSLRVTSWPGRFAVIAVVAGLVVSLIGFAPQASAAGPGGGELCADLYDVTKAPPAENELPGFSGAGTAPSYPNLTYDFDNPGENARGLPELTGRALARYGDVTTGKTLGSPEHVYAAWNRYLETKASQGKQPLPWSKWLNSYVPNMGNNARGKAYEKLATETIGLGGEDWYCQERIPGTEDVDRIYDAVNHKLKIAYEFKSGSSVDAAQLAKDQQIAQRTGYRIQYVFGRKPTAATVRRLQTLRSPYSMRAAPVTSNPGEVAPSPGTEVLDPEPGATQAPESGAATEMIDGSGENAEQAQAVADADEENALLSGDIEDTAIRPGGIDFSTMELRYVSESPDGSGLNYSFQADDNADASTPSYGGLTKAQLTSDALFTWLALPPSTFWVNLNPDQPDKIVDNKLASTDVGRVLLEADLTLKHTGSRLQVPNNPTGDEYWKELQTANGAPCWDPIRSWIEPLPASVREQGGELYILDAPLTVKTERAHLNTQPNGSQPCTQPESVLEHNFETYNKVVLPQVINAVNKAPEFEDLRRVYYSRVTAQWIRDRNAVRPGPFAKIIDSGDVSRWPARTPWSKQTVYSDYVKSYKDGDYHFIRSYPNNGLPWIYDMQVGGVDFSQAPTAPMPDTTFKASYPTLPQTVQTSQESTLQYANSANLWLGAGIGNKTPPPPSSTSPAPPGTPTQAPTASPTAGNPVPPTTSPKPPATATPAASSHLAYTGAPIVAMIVAGLVLLAIGTGLVLWQRHRRRARAAAGPGS